jgi:hypothetical protein
VRQSQKWGGLFFPNVHIARIWHPPTVTCLAPKKIHYVDAVLQMYSEVEGGNFTVLVYSVLINIGKSVLRILKTMCKKSIIIAKGE